MNDSPTPKRRRRGLWWKIPLFLLLLLVLLLVVVWIRLSPIVTHLANQMLPELLGTGVSVERIELKPAKGLASIHGLRIAQPEGFGEGQVLELAHVLAEVDLGSLGSAEGILVRAVELQGLTANITKDGEGLLNVLRLGPPPAAEGAATADEGGASGSTDEGAGDVEAGEDDSATPFPGLRIERVAISEIAVKYRDESTGDKPISIGLGNLDIQVTDAQVTMGDGPEVRLGTGTVTLENLEIDQPAGFGEGALLQFPRLHLDVGTAPFADNVVRLQRLEAEGLRAVIVRDTNGVMNVARLAGGPPPAPALEAEPGDEAVPNDAETEPEFEVAAEPPPGSPVGIHLVELALTDFGVTYRDALLGGEEPIEFLIRDLDLSVQDLMAFLSDPPAPFSPVTLELGLEQGDYPAARLSLFAAVGPIDAGIPNVNAQAAISGFMLDTLGSLVPPGVRETVGANGMEAQLGLGLTATHIDLGGKVKTDAGHGYPVGVKGPLDKPKVDLGPIALAVAGRLTGGVANLATGAAGAAAGLATGAAGGATDVAKGAAGAVGTFGGGLLKSAKAAATLDLGEVKEGMKEATVDVSKGVGKTVGGAGDRMVEEGRKGAGTVTGKERTAAWLAEIATRHSNQVATAREALGAMPFPPAPPASDGSN